MFTLECKSMQNFCVQKRRHYADTEMSFLAVASNNTTGCSCHKIRQGTQIS